MRAVKKLHLIGQKVLGLALHASGVFFAAAVVNGIVFEDKVSLGIVVVVLGLFNTFLKPLLVLFALPFVVLTLGLGLLFINALLLLLAAEVVPGFYVDGFWTACMGAVVISLTHVAANVCLGFWNNRIHFVGMRARPPEQANKTRPPVARIHRPDRANEDVIDI